MGRKERAVLHFDLPVSMAQLPPVLQDQALAAGTHQSPVLGIGVVRDSGEREREREREREINDTLPIHFFITNSFQ